MILQVPLGIVEFVRLRDQLVNNLEWAREITGSAEGELALVMLH